MISLSTQGKLKTRYQIADREKHQRNGRIPSTHLLASSSRNQLGKFQKSAGVPSNENPREKVHSTLPFWFSTTIVGILVLWENNILHWK